MSKKDEKILELSYTIEALEDEVEHWQEVAAEAKAEAQEEKIEYQKLVNYNWELKRMIQVNSDIIKEATGPRKPFFKNERWWNISFELWPGAWGLNYYRYDWQRAIRNGHPATSREGNFQIGPFGFSWNREPKR